MVLAQEVPELDLESIVIGHLKTVTPLIAVVPADMISSKLRRALSPGDKALRIRRFGGLGVPDTDGWLVRYRLQADAFADDELDAFAIAREADVALRSLEGQTIGGAVITRVLKDLAFNNTPDPDSDLARYLFGTVLYAHPAPA